MAGRFYAEVLEEREDGATFFALVDKDGNLSFAVDAGHGLKSYARQQT